jgi:hypothetical protein
VVARNYNPNYLRGRDRRIVVPDQLWEKNTRCYLKKINKLEQKQTKKPGFVFGVLS